jgi:hypothetical protein
MRPSPPTRLRRSPFVAGTLLLVLAAGLVAPAAWLLGARRWPLALGLLALLLLLFGAIERLWQSLSGLWYRRAFDRTRSAERSRFRVVLGGKGQRKGNGHDRDAGEGPDGPGWVM